MFFNLLLQMSTSFRLPEQRSGLRPRLVAARAPEPVIARSHTKMMMRTAHAQKNIHPMLLRIVEGCVKRSSRIGDLLKIDASLSQHVGTPTHALDCVNWLLPLFTLLTKSVHPRLSFRCCLT